MKIRLVKIDDAKNVAELLRQLEHPASVLDAKKYIALTSKNRYHKTFVAEEGEKVIGFVNITVFPEFINGFQARINGLVVDENIRGKGVGRALMQKAEIWAAKKNCKNVKINSNKKRAEAHKFYEKIGFIKTKEQVCFKKDI